MRRRLLTQAIARDAAAPDAWLWRVRRDVLDYMLHRYGKEIPPIGNSESLPSPRPDDVIDIRELAEDALQPADESAPQSCIGPAEVGKIKARLVSLRETNETVRVRRPVPPKPDKFDRFYNPLTMRWQTWDPVVERRLFSDMVSRLDTQAVDSLNHAILSDLGVEPAQAPKLHQELIHEIVKQHELELMDEATTQVSDEPTN